MEGLMVSSNICEGYISEAGKIRNDLRSRFDSLSPVAFLEESEKALGLLDTFRTEGGLRELPEIEEVADIVEMRMQKYGEVRYNCAPLQIN